jgi:hypothetical protein
VPFDDDASTRPEEFPSMHASTRSDVVSRRAFLSVGAALAAAPAGLAAMTALPNLARQEDGAIYTGTGRMRYRVEHDWLVPPQSLRWGDTHGLAQDSAGRIYVSHTVHPTSESKHAIAVFERDGRFATSFGERFAGGGHGLEVRSEGGVEFLYHCDVGRRRLAKTTLDGTLVWEVGAPTEARFRDAACYDGIDAWNPTNVCFAPDGDLFVGDGYGRSFVHRFSKDGAWKATIAGPGDKAGEVSCPHGLWLDERGKEPTLAVADRGNRRIQYFSLDGRHLRFVSTGMRQPCHFKTKDGLLLVPDLSSVVTLLDADDKVVAQLGDGDPTTLRDAERSKFLPGKFIHPHGAIFLADGSILVAEWVPIGRITRLVPAPASA